MSNEKPSLMKCSFTFEQESNCNGSTGDYENLTIECESSLGIDFDKGCYYVLKSDTGWSIDNVNDLQILFDRINKVINENTDTTTNDRTK
jgi:hypothetical protein